MSEIIAQSGYVLKEVKLHRDQCVSSALEVTWLGMLKYKFHRLKGLDTLHLKLRAKDQIKNKKY